MANKTPLVLYSGVPGQIRAGDGLDITKLAYGTANQLLGVNAGATANEWKTLSGTSNEITITHAANSITLALVTPLGIAKGGTALSTLGAANQLLGTNAAAGNLEYKTLSGTANQINVAHAAGAITLSAPQDLTAGGITVTNITQITNRSHTSLSDIGTLTHATIDSYLDQAVKTTSGPTFNNVKILDTDSSNTLNFDTGSNLTVDRTLLFNTGDADRTITLNGNPTLGDWFNQEVKTTSSPSFGNSVSIQSTTDTTVYLKLFRSGSATSWDVYRYGSGGSDIFAIGINGVTEPITITTTGELRFNAGKVFINDTANTGMTQGLTINQGANDNEILSFKSSDIAHGVTSITETDTFGFNQKNSSIGGGIRTYGISTVTANPALDLYGVLVANAVTTKSSTSEGIITLTGVQATGTVIDNVVANGNVVAIKTRQADLILTRFILDADGDSHQDVGTAWTNFDEYEDIALLNDLSLAVSRKSDLIKREFGGFLKYNKQALEKAKLVTFNDDTDSRPFVNMSKLAMLHTGAIQQIGKRLEEMKEIIAIQAEEIRQLREKMQYIQ